MKPFLFYGLLPMLLAVLTSCSPAVERNYLQLEGETMGTYYRITYADAEERDFQPEIDELLRDLNMQVSTYIESSTISRFNRAERELVLSEADTHFLANLEAARTIYERTDGAFDPTVMPLVNYWGFGYAEKKPVTGVDSTRVDSLMRFVGMDKVTLSRENGQAVLRKMLPGVQLDFSALAKGYGVDLVGRRLEAKGVRHYLIDIGGELVGRGKSPRGMAWKVGINVPREEAAFSEIQQTIPLVDKAVATSGNYRNFYEVDGVKYSHTINPKTGYPERNTLLSASVFAGDCMTADGYATACMVMGVDKAYELIDRLPELEAYFIYSDPAGLMQVRYTEGLADDLADDQ
jgi:thiamine biosynthesis lipoprotein